MGPGKLCIGLILNQLRRACSITSDYLSLGTILKTKLMEKGYDQEHIENTFKKNMVKQFPDKLIQGKKETKKMVASTI